MYRIAKRFRFAAAHHLPTLPPEHKCSRPHGHNYTVEVVLVAFTLDEHGFVLDYGELSRTVGWSIREHFDHRDLNALADAPKQYGPTAEWLAATFYFLTEDLLRKDGLLTEGKLAVDSVRVSETDDTWAEFSIGREER